MNSMSELKTALAAGSKNKKNNSTKNASWYNKQRQLHVGEMSSHEDVSVRRAVVESECCAVGVLKTRIEVETDSDTLRAILTHVSLPKKQLADFCASSRVDQFSDDAELISYIRSTLNV